MPVWGVWVVNAFYFSTGAESRKAKNLASNPECVVCPENAEEAVIMEGTARKLDARGGAAAGRRSLPAEVRFQYRVDG
jgi:nitroimidazol reductase NimA-like FMN-containing flavoprotein (pyridoxamine 5'-phosphate oxidase superfamily)